MVNFINFLYDNRYISLGVYLIIVNLAVFILCGIDKKRAVNRLPRIRERTFYVLSLFGGATLMLLGMCIFRHKTKKSGFVILIPLFILIHLVILLLLEAKFDFLSTLIF